MVAATGILVAVIAVGLLGPNPSTASPGPTAPNAPVADGAAATGAAPTEAAPTEAGPAPSNEGDAAAGPPPRSRFGLDPASVPAALEALARGDAGSTWVTVVGWLSIRPGEVMCLPGATSSGPACMQEGILTADPAPSLRWDHGRAIEVDPAVPHLRPVFPPGISIPPLDDEAGTIGSPPLAGMLPVQLVVLVGHFDVSGTDECRYGFLGCSGPFVVAGVE